VELDALDPDDLQQLYQAAIDQYWDDDAHSEVLDREDEDVSTLSRLADEFDGLEP
jgi:hypothetical protein